MNCHISQDNTVFEMYSFYCDIIIVHCNVFLMVDGLNDESFQQIHLNVRMSSSYIVKDAIQNGKLGQLWHCFIKNDACFHDSYK